MGILNKIRIKYKENKLIKGQDEFVIKSLPKEKDNSKIDIKNVVQNMEKTQNMYEVVQNNFSEIIQQDNVRSTLKYLKDDDVFKLLEKNQEELKRRSKILNAIEAIGDNDKKINAVLKNIQSLEDIELARILENLTQEKTEEAKNEIEQKKIKIISLKILEHIIKYGAAWHLNELTRTLEKEKSKLTVLDLCLDSMTDYETNKNKQIPPETKEKLIVELLMNTKIKERQKYDKIDEIMKKGIFEENSGDELKRKLQAKKKEKQDKSR